MSCNEWKEANLGDFIELNYGKSLPKTKRVEGIYNVYGSSGITGTHNEYLVEGPGIIVGRKGTIGKVSYEEHNFFPIDTTYYITKSSEYNLKFMYYFLQTLSLENMNSHSAVPGLNREEVYKLKVKIPHLQEQEKIANILSSLDDKIELNNEMNKTLEEMAQSIFKRWFVDFEFPNEDGEPYKSSGGEMVDSELGMIPKGWEVKKISELIEVKDGTHASPKVSKEGFPLVTSKHIKGDRIAIEDAKIISEKDYLEVNKRSKVDTGDILISMIGTVGLTYFVQEEEINFAIKNIGLFKTSQNKTLSEYFYLYLKSDNMKNYIEARLAGTTQKYISLGELRNIPVVLPNDSIIDKFKKVVGVLLDKRRLNIINNEELMITRDTLLPKLMNGEIMI